jgi:NAD(P)-dependent dehydrogenase (short-subunit alcohol dehydrogenase family)
MNVNQLPSQGGRTIIVTGANTGLGYETTITLAKKGAKVIMACRNVSKANKAKKSIEKQVPKADLEVMEIDLSNLNSVRKFAQEFQEKHDELSILINNAGVMMTPYMETDEGFELQFVSNYLGHFLLTGLLLPNLLKTLHSRIVSLSSLIHKNGKIKLDDLQSKKKYNPQNAYGQSKLACLLFAFELQRRLEKAGISDTLSTASHPGVADTELSRHLPKLLNLVLKYTIGPLITHSANEGAKPTILASIGKAKGGDYFGPTGFMEMKGKAGKAKSSASAHDENLAEKLWEVSEELVNQKYL